MCSAKLDGYERWKKCCVLHKVDPCHFQDDPSRLTVHIRRHFNVNNIHSSLEHYNCPRTFDNTHFELDSLLQQEKTMDSIDHWTVSVDEFEAL